MGPCMTKQDMSYSKQEKHGINKDDSLVFT